MNPRSAIGFTLALSKQAGPTLPGQPTLRSQNLAERRCSRSEGSLNGGSERSHRSDQRNGDQRQQNGVFGCRQALIFLYELTNHVQHGDYLSVFLGYGFCLSKRVESFCAPTFIRD
jgi:hypothetical protein